MAKKDITVKHISSDSVDPEVAKIMGPLPVDAEPKMSSVTDKPESIIDESIGSKDEEVISVESDVDKSIGDKELKGPPAVDNSNVKPVAIAINEDADVKEADELDDTTEAESDSTASETETFETSGTPEGDENNRTTELDTESTEATDNSEATEPESEVQITDEENTAPVDINATISSDTDIDDTDAAVKDIIANEGDEVLQAEDKKIAEFVPPPKKPKGIKAFFASWWHNRRARNLTLLFIAIAVIAAGVIPASRYFILNTAGVSVSTSFSVIDSKSGYAIKNVEVTLSNQTAKTDDNGKVTINNLKLGTNHLTLKKRSFSTLDQDIVIGWGSNPYDSPFQLSPVGSQFNFTITDWMSGKPVAKAKISDGDSVAISGDDGKATLTIEPTDSDIKLTVNAEFYREEKISITATEKAAKSLALIPAMPDVFVSKRSGKYDLYKKDIDGQNEAVLLAGTGSEQENLALLVHPGGSIAAFASTRDGKHDKDGYMLSNLYIVNISAKTVTKVANSEAERIQIIDWIGDKLIYVKVTAGPSAATPGRQRIYSYDSKQDNQTELASSNYFNDVEVINNNVYYAPTGEPKLVKIGTDGSAATTIIEKETWYLTRSVYDKLLANVSGNLWYEQNLSSGKVSQLTGTPANTTNRIYIDSPDSSKSTWIDNRDGKGTLIVTDTKLLTDKVYQSKGGLTYPLRWLSNKHLLYRVSNTQETADYVINIEGGDPKKVGDVTSTGGTSRWYYY